MRHSAPIPYLIKILTRALACLFLPAMVSVSTPTPRAATIGQGGTIDARAIEGLIAESGAETVAVAWCDLATGEQFLINPDVSFHAASTMKVPVMMEVFRQVRSGKLRLDLPIQIKNEFASIADGSRYSISKESDSDQEMYGRLGQTMSVRELLHRMITVSSNLATNILVERVTARKVMEHMRGIGARNIRVLRGVEDGKAFAQGLNNQTTARDLMIILRRIAERRAVSPQASDEMINIMLDQRFNEGIPAGVKPPARVAHKTGSITKISHDAGIVFPPGRKPYVLVVLTRGIADQKRASRFIADVSRAIFDRVAARQRPASEKSQPAFVR